jgi:hypothetical protein
MPRGGVNQSWQRDESSKLSSTAANYHQQQQTIMSDDSNDHRRQVRSNFRQLVDEWYYDRPENLSPVVWNDTPFRNTPGGMRHEIV